MRAIHGWRLPVSIAVLALVLPAGAYEPFEEETTPSGRSKTDVSVLVVRTFDKNGKPSSQGTGFMVDQQGDIITSRHLLDDGHKVEAVTVEGKIFPVKSVLAEDKQADLIRLRADIPSDMVHPLVLAYETPVLNQKIMVRVSALLFSDGEVSAVREIPHFGKVYETTAPVSAVSTGSPVVDTKGKVLGVTTYLTIEGEAICVTIPSRRIKDMSGEPKEISQWHATRPEYSEGAAEKFYELGLRYLWVGKCDQALPLFRQAVKKKPDFREAYGQLAHCYGIANQAQDQAQAIQQLIRISPKDVSLYFRLARVYGNNGYHKEVLDIINHALRVDSESYEAYALMGWARGKMGNHEEAIKACKRAISLKADYDPAHVYLGVAYANSNRSGLALSAFKQAVNINSRNTEAHLEAAKIYAEDEEYDQEVISLTQAATNDPDNAEAHRMLGEAFLNHKEDYPQALRTLGRAKQLAPKDPKVLYSLGVAHMKSGDKERALEQLGALTAIDKQRAWELRRLIERKP